MSLQNALDFAKQHRSRFVDQLGELVSIPSVSTNPDNFKDVRLAADWVADYMRRIGLENVQSFPPDNHPILYADWLHAGPDAPTMLIYGHYDVQPAEPLEQWHSDPFKPVVRGDNLYGRGASDMKGNVLGSLYAVESMLAKGKPLVNFKFLIEGQEEIGSPDLAEFMESHKTLLASDFCVNPDTGMLGATAPTITYALRGLAYFELRVYGPEHDLHSGLYGGVVHNPANALSKLIGGMHDEHGRVTLPGFYDDVLALSDEERAELARLPETESEMAKVAGVSKLWGEKGFTAVERRGARPTLDVNGLYSGFTGKGAKTVLPAFAMAKISCRLVANQDSATIRGMFESYLKANAPDTIRWELIELNNSPASISDRDSRWVQAMMGAQEKAWGVRSMFKREGGSVPVVGDLKDILGIESVNIGCGLPDDGVHGPNEKVHLPTFYRFIDSMIYFIDNLSN